MDTNGTLHDQLTANDHNVTGVGLSSGTVYHRVGATVVIDNISGPAPLESTFTNSFNFISQGAASNTLLLETFHITINANGSVTAFVDNFRLECR